MMPVTVHLLTVPREQPQDDIAVFGILKHDLCDRAINRLFFLHVVGFLSITVQRSGWGRMLLLCAVQMNRDHCQAGQIGPPRQPDLPHELFGLRRASIQIKIELSLSGARILYYERLYS